MRIVGEFREFAVKGNVIDLAVGIVIGAAFGKIVASLVTDLLMPPISMVLGGIDFTDRFWVLRGGSYTTLEEARTAGAVTLNYGAFLNTVLEFVIIAFAVFLLVKQLNRMRRRGSPPPPDTRPCPECLATIPKKATRCSHCAIQVQAVTG